MIRPTHLAAAAAALALLAGCGGGSEAAPVTHHRTEVASATPGGSTSASATGTASGTTTATRSVSAAATTSATAGTASAPAAGTPASTSSAPATGASKPRPTPDDGSRTLQIPVLGVRAPVTSCATEGGEVTPPGDIAAVCRWSGSQPYAATAGTTIIVGHSTRSADTAGALEYIRELRVGDTATVAGQTWRVAEVLPGVDKHQLPAWIVDHAGPRQLGLVTCETSSRTRNDLVRLVPVG
ncbi:class F sortase [Arsenicicoccus sp. oral taxon 190]|uniref:class F sortase n=1 Tax=Arsenicicoccus sp. oral taxon 190 TaxID=1658671 RepID=UPI00067A3556|nr:class F sortase [Arsenicicoccus sp. oral taxon 190]AKT50726.1 hypothetical protein ADJ73_04315 [Arsenicicoccus sp. oral taxon 190]